MPTFIHLSDLHIHGSQQKSNNVNARKIVEYLLAFYDGAKPTILLGGDVVDDGAAGQYENAVEILRPLIAAGFPMVAVPGNHDYGRWGNFYTEHSQALFQQHILADLIGWPDAAVPGTVMEDLYPWAQVVDGVLVLAMDSVAANEDEFAHFASGEIGQTQLTRASDIMKQHTDKKVLVLFHHHPFYRKFGLELDDAHRVLRTLADRANILCFGHRHVSEIWYDRDGIDAVLASGKTTSRNGRYQFQFREIEMDPASDQFAVTMRTFRND